MATYKEIIGTNIQVLSSDPENPLLGQIWYNSTSNTLKGRGTIASTAWSSGGTLNTARKYQAGAGDSNSASITFGNYPREAITELYNGASWTEVADLNENKGLFSGTGTSTSAITAGGNADPGKSQNTELWNGSSWTEVANLPAVISRNVLGGTQTSAVSSGGEGPGGETADANSWNGSSWTEISDMNQAHQLNSGCGASSTNAISVGDFKFNPESPPVAAVVESWNGSSWTEVSDLNTGRSYTTSSGFSNTDVTTSGGQAGDNPGAAYALTEIWNGSSWTESADLSTARGLSGSIGGASNSALQTGGTPSQSTATEEWLKAGVATLTFVDS